LTFLGLAILAAQEIFGGEVAREFFGWFKSKFGKKRGNDGVKINGCLIILLDII
jgi:hypothetical protein